MTQQEYYLVIVYSGTWRDFDVAQGFKSETEALEFARSRTYGSAVVVKGTVERWFEGKSDKPIAIYWYGKKFIPEK